MATLRIQYSKEKGGAETLTVKILDRYDNPPKLSPSYDIAKGEILRCNVRDENGIGNVDIYDGSADDPEKSHPLITDLYVDRERLITFPLGEDARVLPFAGDFSDCMIEKD